MNDDRLKLTGDEEIEVTVKDLMIELRGRIESGGGFGISDAVSDEKDSAGKERFADEES
jgi:hypothetical protein